MATTMLKRELERRHRIEEQRALEAEIPQLSTDQRVIHHKFGYGRIVAIDGQKLDIEFEKAGLKRVLHAFVRAVEDE